MCQPSTRYEEVNYGTKTTKRETPTEESKATEPPAILMLSIRLHLKQYPSAIHCQENPLYIESST